jgi:hypothetical protein
MKKLTEINLLTNNIIIYKKIFNFGLFTQLSIKKQLGLSLYKEKINFNLNFEMKNNLFIIIIYYKILENLIIDTRYYKKMYDFYQNLFENKNFLKRTVRLKMGLPVNGQRSKTNAKNARKKFYRKFLNRIIF